jgi:hypothetical protein
MNQLSESPVMNFFCKILLAEKCLPLLFRNRKAMAQNKKVPSIQPKEKKCCDCATD